LSIFDEEIPNNRTLCDELDKPDAALYELGWYMPYYLNVYYEPWETPSFLIALYK